MNYLQRSVLMCLLLITGTVGFAQQKKKYQGLLWEISGRNMQKPSYLFGTMHVSSKLAFHLSDSFYYCIRRSDIVALETDPQRLQEDFSKSNMLRLSSRYVTELSNSGNMSKDAFTIGAYNDLIRTGLTYRPEMINHLLYRSFAAQEDFEEDTFLDMYIFQVGRKMGKKATGVESFQESERLMLEAYRDASKEKKTKKPVRESESATDVRTLLNDAYRRGNLDVLDSLSNEQYSSPAFIEKFLYRRNENMFHVIDSIISHASLFAGVGAAHLPGDRGLISLLRKAGYNVRPVAITNRDSEQKDQLEKIKAPVTFQPYTSEDGWIKAELPGKLYNFSALTMLHQLQYADLANGAYYLVSRIKTNALSLGQTEQDVFEKIDSLLYENIPGKIISKNTIHRNGYTGFDIRNRTRRGDMQRYNIFITPFEVFIFKISGNGEYADGEEADHFFSSIQLKPMSSSGWVTYQAPSAGFSVKMPHIPVFANNITLRSLGKRQEYEALDKQTGNSFLIIRKTIPDYSVLEEDTVDLGFAEESFQQSQFVKQQKGRKVITWQGRPCLEFTDLNNDNSYTQTRIFAQGPHYYLLAARYRNDRKQAQEFFNSFVPGNPVYKQFEPYTDTSLHYTVRTAVTPKDDDALAATFTGVSRTEENTDHLYKSQSQPFRVDSTGEEIIIFFQKFDRYFSVKDSALYWENQINDITDKGDYVIQRKQFSTLPGGGMSMLLQMRDTNSTRGFLCKVIIRNGAQYTLSNITDNIQGPSAFVNTFFDSFTPRDTVFGGSIFRSKAPEFFADLASKDSTIRKQARSSIEKVKFEKEHAPALIHVIRNWNSSEKNYLDTKNELFLKLGTIHHPDVLPFLKNAYIAANDTASLQHSILTGILRQQTAEGNALFKELVLKEIPVFSGDQFIYSLLHPLYDSLQLTRSLFPDLLELTALTDYKEPVYSLLATLVDSSMINPSLYEHHISQIAFDARIALQKDLAGEQEQGTANEEQDEERYHSNTTLQDYATLLLPYRNSNRNAARFFARYETIKNPLQQISLAILYLRNHLPVSDSLMESIAAQEKYRITLWDALSDIKQLDKFPGAYKKQEAIAKSVLYSAVNYNTKLDSVVLLSKQHTTHRFKKGIVYLYKYKQKEEDSWYLGISGLQPDDEKMCSNNESLTQLTDIRFNTNQPIPEQFHKVLRRVKYRNRYKWDYDMNLGAMMNSNN